MAHARNLKSIRWTSQATFRGVLHRKMIYFLLATYALTVLPQVFGARHRARHAHGASASRWHFVRLEGEEIGWKIMKGSLRETAVAMSANGETRSAIRTAGKGTTWRSSNRIVASSTTVAEREMDEGEGKDSDGEEELKEDDTFYYEMRARAPGYRAPASARAAVSQPSGFSDESEKRDGDGGDGGRSILDEKVKSLNLVVIVGIASGGLIGLIVLVLLCVWCVRMKKARRMTDVAMEVGDKNEFVPHEGQVGGGRERRDSTPWGHPPRGGI